MPPAKIIVRNCVWTNERSPGPGAGTFRNVVNATKKKTRKRDADGRGSGRPFHSDLVRPSSLDRTGRPADRTGPVDPVHSAPIDLAAHSADPFSPYRLP